MKIWTMVVAVGLAVSAVEADNKDCVPYCIDIYKPVCGSDGKTYPNQCSFNYKKCSTKNDKLTVVVQGECPTSSSGSGSGGSICEKGCPKIMMPVCGSDGKTYSNECDLNNAKCTNSKLTLASKGRCGSSSSSGSAGFDCSITMCTADYSPVCGSDGKMYSNECKLDIAHCKNSSITMVNPSECKGH